MDVLLARRVTQLMIVEWFYWIYPVGGLKFLRFPTCFSGSGMVCYNRDTMLFYIPRKTNVPKSSFDTVAKPNRVIWDSISLLRSRSLLNQIFQIDVCFFRHIFPTKSVEIYSSLHVHTHTYMYKRINELHKKKNKQINWIWISFSISQFDRSVYMSTV